MNRALDEPVTPELGREAAERLGVTALITGAIAPLGSRYVITLEGMNAKTGDTLAREQVQAGGREDVLDALGTGARNLRERLGESVGSIQTFDRPLQEATTSSLEALKLFTQGRELVTQARHADAIPFLERALELDPGFAMAHGILTAVYASIPGGSEKGRVHATRAYELRDRITELERYYVSFLYFHSTRGDLVRAAEVMGLAVQTYPRHASFRNNLAFTLLRLGRYEEAVEHAREGLRLDPNLGVVYSNLAWALRALGQYAEAKSVISKAHERQLDFFAMRINLLLIAYAEGDRHGMAQQLEWARGKPAEPSLAAHAAMVELFEGRPVGRRFTKALADKAWSREISARYAALGDCERARAVVANKLDPYAAALCGDLAEAEGMAARLEADPEAPITAVRDITVPVTRALVEAARGNTERAHKSLQPALAFEMSQVAYFWPTYVSGLIYMKEGAAAEARAQFDRIIERRSVSPNEPVYPLAHLGAARAAILQRKTAQAKKYYEALLLLWKDADASIPAVREARKEYEQVNSR